MSKMTNAAKETRETKKTKKVTNFMGGNSYEINPMDTLKMISASSIFGEPQYYRNGEFAKATMNDLKYSIDPILNEYIIVGKEYVGKKTSEIMEDAIDTALDYDFAGVIEWAKELRKEYYMRLNPQIIMVRAAIHPKRQEYTEKNPGAFNDAQMIVMARGDDVIAQLTYYIFKMGSKNNLPNILKRTWAKKVSTLSPYELYKYRNHGLGLIDVIRISHAKGNNINTLMETGTIEIPKTSATWETLRASGMNWEDILKQIKMNHMALLRNLRGIFSEIDDLSKCKELMDQLEKGVERGKQFPFRYMSAYNVINSAKVNHKPNILEGLEKCLDAACSNLPILPGKNAFLSDNSGSAWGAFTSEYGSVGVAEIGNLSSVIGAANSDEGYVYKFGDKLIEFPINKRQGILSQATAISQKHSSDVGGSTENGIWLFFEKAILEKIKWDNIFIYSDMQAGHGWLYGIEGQMKNCKEWGCCANRRCSNPYIDVAKLVERYRQEVNPKVNIYCIQTAGYNNVLIPEYAYRTNVLYGWTGKELLFADVMNKFWDEKDAQKEATKKNKQ